MKLKLNWFTQDQAQPLHSSCADPFKFLKCVNLDCVISGSGGLRLHSPLILCGIQIQLTSEQLQH